jgi:hypothetical protein
LGCFDAPGYLAGLLDFCRFVPNGYFSLQFAQPLRRADILLTQERELLIDGHLLVPDYGLP